MSTDWNIKCLDCDDTHYFNDANHRDREMAILVKHSKVISALAPLEEEFGYSLSLSFGGYGEVDVRWFAKHAGHRLVPINEYGGYMDQCHEFVKCRCGSSSRCTKLPDHEGEHDATPRT
jgi:hypothetical protein